MVVDKINAKMLTRNVLHCLLLYPNGASETRTLPTNATCCNSGSATEPCQQGLPQPLCHVCTSPGEGCGERKKTLRGGRNLLCRNTEGVYPHHQICRDTGGGIPPMRGVYPPQCRDTVDYTPSVVCPPGVATLEGYTPHARGIPSPVSRHRRLSCTPCCVATQEGYTPLA